MTTASNNFITALYDGFYGRDADASGLAYWAGQIDSGEMTAAQVAETFFYAPEFQSTVGPVARLYFAALDRIPDAAGLDFWVNEYRAGATLDDLGQSFVDSPEFTATYGELSDADFINQVYVNILNREADTDGLNYWVDALTNGATRGQILVNFAESTEFAALTASDIQTTLVYEGLVGRPPTTEELAGATGQDLAVTIDTALDEYAGDLPLSFTVTASATTVVEGNDLIFTITPVGEVYQDTTFSYIITGRDLDDVNTNTAATPGQDFSPYQGTVTLTAGQTEATTITIAINQDAAGVDASALEGLRFTLLDASGSAVTTQDITVADALTGITFNIDSTDPDIMRLTGDQAARIDFTNPANQVKGLDLDGDGIIENDGMENAITGMAANYSIVDAYARNPLNQLDSANNFLGNIQFDGTGFEGDGVSTDGNIFLGGLGADTAFGGIGNDFLTGGGTVAGMDALVGGRNADFFFASLSFIDATDGNNLWLDGGSTSDDAAVGNNTPQDSDWLLLEASDDDEPVTINLTVEGTGAIPAGGAQIFTTRAGQAVVGMHEIEHIDASGNLYGFLDNITVAIGEGAFTTTVDGTPLDLNSAYGATAQLNITGSVANNIIIGGYDNDLINGGPAVGSGNDILMGGNMAYLAAHLNNPNLLQGVNVPAGQTAIINDGMDNLNGQDGDDHLVMEMDNGTYTGGADTATTGGDVLWLTDFVAGVEVAVDADGTISASAANVSDLISDSIVRLDLAAQGGQNASSGYGGQDRGATADQSKYINDVIDNTNNDGAQATITGMESVNATGLGPIDYLAAGTNDPDLTSFKNQANFQGLEADLDLRGTNGANLGKVVDINADGINETYSVDNRLYANTGDDVLEGRGGNDLLMGGAGDDDFIFAIDGDRSGDDLDTIHRLVDADGDNIWDGWDATDVNNIWNGDLGADFGQSTSATMNSTLTLTLKDNTPGATDLEGFPVSGVVFEIGGVRYTLSVEIAEGSTRTYANFVDALETAIAAEDAIKDLTVALNTDNTITITDPAGGTFTEVGYTWIDNIAPAAGNLVWDQAVGAPVTTTSSDRIIFASYEDRLDGELVNDDANINSTADPVTLGANAYAEDLVVRFDTDGNGTTVLAEGQNYNVDFTNLANNDTVSVTVNNVTYTQTMGKLFDGTAIVETAAQFVIRLCNEINGSTDGDATDGSLVATPGGVVNVANNTVRMILNQGDYNAGQTVGGQTVFMADPVVTLGNASGGEPANALVTNVSTSQITLFEYDGRNNNLNNDNVLFLGAAGMENGRVTNAANSRSIFETAAAAGGALNGSDALVLDSMTDSDILATNFSLHGDDYLIGGDGADVITAGTGDDRIQGSKGTDTVDGGKNLYVVTTNTGDAVETMSTSEASARRTATGVLNVAFLRQDAANGAQAGFNDTLVFNQDDFDASTSFTIAVNATGGITAGDRSGTVTVSNAQGTTTFSNIEAVRTLSGDGTHAGQGKDTLDVSALSNVALALAATGNAGITYNMTDGGGDIDGTINDAPIVTTTINTNNLMFVNGVETFVGGSGDDTLNIDESQVRYDNRFEGAANRTDAATTDTVDVVGDTIRYNHSDMDGNGVADTTDLDADGFLDANEVFEDLNVNAAANTIEDVDGDGVLDAGEDLNANGRLDYNEDLNGNGVLDAGEAVNAGVGLDVDEYFYGRTAVAMRPSVTVAIESASDTDTVTMTNGILGSGTSVDTLVNVETIYLNDAARSNYRDTLDVSSIATGATVKFQPFTTDAPTKMLKDYGMTTGLVVDSTTNTIKAAIDDITDLENVKFGAGNDTVILADAMTNRLQKAETITADATKWETHTYTLSGQLDTVAGAANDATITINGYTVQESAIVGTGANGARTAWDVANKFATDFAGNNQVFDINFPNLAAVQHQTIAGNEMLLFTFHGTLAGNVPNTILGAADVNLHNDTGTFKIGAETVAQEYVGNNAFNFFRADAVNRVTIANQGLFKYDLGAGTSDTVDYRNESNQDIAVVVDFTGTATMDRAVVAADIDNIHLNLATDRVDEFTGADRFYAGNGDFNESIVDLSQHTTDIQVVFSPNVVTDENARLITLMYNGATMTKQFLDDSLTTAERADDLAANPLDRINNNLQEAYWNRIEGNDGNETITLTDYVSGHNMAFNLQGGANVVDYNPTTIGVQMRIQDVKNIANSLTSTQQMVIVDTYDQYGGNDSNKATVDGVHTTTGDIGTLRIQGSSSGDDYINMTAVTVAYAIDLNIAEASGIKGTVTLSAKDANGDGDTLDVNDQPAAVVTVSGFENIAGNNLSNTYTLNTFVNDVYMGTGNDTLTVSRLEDLSGDTIVADMVVDLLTTQTAVEAGTLTVAGQAATATTKSDTIKFVDTVDSTGKVTATLTDGLYTFNLGASDVTGVFAQDQFTGGAGNSATLYGFENIDASGLSDKNDRFAITGGATQSIIRGGAGNDILNMGAGGGTVDGGAGLDTIDFGAGAVVGEWSSGDSNDGTTAADSTIDVVTNFGTGVDKIRIMATGSKLTGSFATAPEANRVLASGELSVYYANDTKQLLVDMNADGKADVTGDLVIDLSGATNTAVAVGDVEFVLTGTSGADNLIGGSTNDTLNGGAGADYLSGGLTKVTQEVHTYTLAGTGLTAAQTLTIDGVTVTAGVATQGTIVAASDADAVGAAFVREWNANPAAFTNEPSLATVTYDSLANGLTFTFDTDAGNVADTLLGAAAGTGAAIAGAETVSTQYAVTANETGADLIRGGEGVDSMYGGAGDDTFVLVGSLTQYDVDYYTKLINTNGPTTVVPSALSSVLSYKDLMALRTVSDVDAVAAAAPREVIDGGTGTNTVHVYGTALMAGLTNATTVTDYVDLKNANLVVHSNVTMSAAQLAGLNITFADASSQVTVIAANGTATGDTTHVLKGSDLLATSTQFQTDYKTGNLDLSGTVNDVTVTKSYTLTPAATSVNEGGTAVFNLTTTGITSGTVLDFTISGTGVTAADVTGGLTGSVTVNANAAQISIPVLADTTTEGAETMTVTLGTGLATANMILNDTSVSLVTPGTLTYSAATLNEAAANNGTVTETITVTLAGDTFVAVPTATITGVPAGLTGVFTPLTTTTGTISLTGTAAAHANANDASMTVAFDAADFTKGVAATGASQAIAINFADAPVLTNVSADTGTVATPVTLDAATGLWNYTDNAATEGVVVINNFASGDHITISNYGADPTVYAFVNNGPDVDISYNNAGTLNQITLMGVVNAAALVYDLASFETAIGFDALTFA